MKYLVTIYIDENQENAYTRADWKKLDEGYEIFAKEANKKDYLLGGGALMPPSSAKTLRVRRGEALITDGPFAETKEQMGGYFLLECPSFEEAVSVAKLMPGAQSNCVEIRRIAEPEDML